MRVSETTVAQIDFSFFVAFPISGDEMKMSVCKFEPLLKYFQFSVEHIDILQR